MLTATIRSHFTRLAALLCPLLLRSRLAIPAAALALTAAPAAAAFKLYDTGTDNAGNLLAGDVPDPHWTVINPANAVTPPIHPSYVDYWLPEIITPGNATGWMQPNDAEINAFPGFFPFPGHVRRYKTTFDLTGHDPATAYINLRWAMDDGAVGVMLNGNTVPGGGTAPLAFSGWNPLTINSGFVSGINTLEFLVGNVDERMGIMVDFTEYGARACGNWVAGRDLAANEQVTATETQNPNATVPAWSYGYRAGLASSAISLFTPAQHVNNVLAATGLDGFITGGTAASATAPVMWVNGTGAPFTRPGLTTLAVREIEIAPGPAVASNQIAVVRWTAPATGLYSISAAWRDINPSGGDGASADIVLNGTVIYSQVWANGGPGVSTSLPSVSLLAGDVVDFAVGARGDHNSDSTAFDATIEAVTAPGAAPAGFALIPGGTFTMGDSVEGVADETPHTVNVSAFYMATRETTRTQWDETTSWIAASGLGYDIGAAGASGAAHPMYLNWWNAVKWCNARSEQKGLTPCYTLGGAVVRSGTPASIVCDFTKNGYRLPTESEWEKAARGGIPGRRFATGNTLAHTTANYHSDHANTFDVSATSGYHPSFSVGTIYTAPAGSFPANPYGLYDMDGNVWEWCWDWYNTYPASGALNPQGVLDTAYQERVIRSGAWNFNAFMARSANRDSGLPAGEITGHIGFRIAQTAIVLPLLNTPPCFALPATTPTATPAGTTWTVQSTPGTVAKLWNGIACSADGKTVAAVVQNGGIYRSVDSGVTWTQDASAPNLSWSTICSSADGTKLAAPARSGRIWTCNAAGTWTEQMNSPVGQWYDIKCTPDGQQIVATQWAGAQTIWRSPDGGVTWSQTGAPVTQWRCIATSHNGYRLLAAAFGDGIYYSDNQGSTWTRIQSGGTGNWQGVAMSWDGSVFWTAVQGGNLFSSTDLGANWTQQSITGAWTYMACSWDGTRVAATRSNAPIAVRSLVAPYDFFPQGSTGLWVAVAMSADGNFLAANQYGTGNGGTGRIYTSVPGTSGPTVAACSGPQSIANFLTKIQPGPPCEAWQSVTFTVTNNNNALFTQQPAISPNGTLTYAPGTTAGTAVVTVYATDNGGTANGGWNQSIWQTFTITVTPDTAPTVSNIADVTINEDAATANIGFTVADADPGTTLTVSATSSNTTLLPNANITLGGTTGSRTIRCTPAANQCGTTTVTVTVSDGCLTATDTFILTVNCVNDAPSCTLATVPTVIGCSGPVTRTGFVTSSSPGPADESTQTITYAITGNTNPGMFLAGGLPAISPNGSTLTYNPGPSGGTATITVTKTDSGGTANGGVNTATATFTITVTPDTAPTISNIANVTINQNTATGLINFTANDVDPGTTLSVTATSSNTTLLPNANIALGGSGGTRTIQCTPAANQSGTATVTVTVSDGCLTATDTFVLTVLATPTVVTYPASGITGTGAVLFGALTSTGGVTVTETGIVHSASNIPDNQAPGAGNTKFPQGLAVGNFSQTVQNQTPGTTCCYRAYALYSGTYIYGAQLKVTFLPAPLGYELTPCWSVVTCFSGAALSGPNSSAYVMGQINTNPGVLPNWGKTPNVPPMNHHTDWTRARMGEVFGVTLDKGNAGNGQAPNSFVSATSIYNTSHWLHYNQWPTNGTVGDTFGTWREPGGIYRIDGTTGAVVNYARVPNAGTITNDATAKSQAPAALGNLCFDAGRRMIYVSNLDDGVIYKVAWATTGWPFTATPFFDHGKDGLPLANRILDTPGSGPTADGRRVWAVQLWQDRLYYSVWNGLTSTGGTSRANDDSSEIWSVALDLTTGAPLAATTRLECGTGRSRPISDMTFGESGVMMVAERGCIIAGANPTAAQVTAGILPKMIDTAYPHDANIFQFRRNPSLQWIASPNNYTVGNYKASYSPFKGYDGAGGIDMDCDDTVLATGNALALADGIQYAWYGLQVIPAAVNPNGNALNFIRDSHLIHYDINPTTGLPVADWTAKSTPGDVAFVRHQCPCFRVVNEQTDCVGTSLRWAVTLTNTSGFDISYLNFEDLPAGVTVTGGQAAMTFAPAFLAGETRTFIFNLTVPANPPAEICFSLFASPATLCPCCTMEFCIRPECCLRAEREEFRSIDGVLNYCFDLTNLSGVTATRMVLASTPAGSNCPLFLNPIVALTPPLAHGASRSFCVPLVAPSSCPRLNFVISLHDADYRVCCSQARSIPWCRGDVILGTPSAARAIRPGVDYKCMLLEDYSEIAAVEFIVDGVVRRTLTSPPWAVPDDIALSPGSHSVGHVTLLKRGIRIEGNFREVVIPAAGAPAPLQRPALHLQTNIRTSDNALVFSWDDPGDILETTTDLNGTWERLPDASSPYIHGDYSEGKRFFRLIRP